MARQPTARPQAEVEVHRDAPRHGEYEVVLDPSVVPSIDAGTWQPDPKRHLSILFDVFALGQQTRTLVQTAMRGAGMRPDEYAAYSAVFEAGEVTMTEVARQLGMPITTAADYVRSMQTRGHLRRTVHPRDSRAYLLRLTAAGLRAHRKASAAFNAAYQALIAELAPLDEEATRAVLRQLAESAARATATLTAPAAPAATQHRS